MGEPSKSTLSVLCETVVVEDAEEEGVKGKWRAGRTHDTHFTGNPSPCIPLPSALTLHLHIYIYTVLSTLSEPTISSNFINLLV